MASALLSLRFIRIFPSFFLLGTLLLLLACGDGPTRPNNVNTLVLGDNFMVFVKPNGTVWAVGDNQYGQLGNGTFDAVAEPFQVPGLENVVGVYLDAPNYLLVTAVLALQADGSLWVWGRLNSDRIVNFPTRLGHVPSLIDVNVRSSSDFYGVSTSHELVRFDWDRLMPDRVPNVAAVNGDFVLTTDGKVGTAIFSSFPAVVGHVVPIVGLDDVHTIEPYKFWGVRATKWDGSVWYYDPQAHPMPSALEKEEVADAPDVGFAYTDYACAVDRCVFIDEVGTAHFYGRPFGPSLTGASYDFPVEGSILPVPVAGLANIKQVAAAINQMAVLHSDGTVSIIDLFGGWSPKGSGSVALREPIAVRGLDSIVEIKATAQGGVALRSDGTVWTWSFSHNDTLAPAVSATLVTGLPKIVSIAASEDQITDVSSNQSHVLALDDSGHVWAFGSNSHGQLGDGSLVDREKPALVEGLSDVIDIAAAYQHSMAVTRDGRVWGWGAAFPSRQNATPVPVLLPGLENVRHVTVGYYGRVMAIDNNGSVLDLNQLFGSRELVAGIPSVTEVRTSMQIHAASDASGTLWTWGDPFFSGRGLGAGRDPAPVLSVGPVKSFAFAWWYSVAVRGDGSVWIWGARLGIPIWTTPNFLAHETSQIPLGWDRE